MSKSNLRKQKSKSKLQDIFDQGSKFVSNNFIALFLFSDLKPFSATVIASKKIGNAVKRNRSKRRLREIIRLHIKPNAPNLRLILISRNNTATSDYSKLLLDCNKLIKEISNQISLQTID